MTTSLAEGRPRIGRPFASRDTAPPRSRAPRAWAPEAWAVAGWVALVVGAHLLGEALLEQGWRTRIHAAPLIGRFETWISWRTVPVVVAAVFAVALLPRFAQRASWPVLSWGSGAGLAAWSGLLAFNRDGVRELGRPMALPGHVLGDVGAVAGPGSFLDQFVETIDRYGTHTRAHPPGFVVVLWFLDRVGLGGAQWAGVLVVVGGALAVPAVLLVVRDFAGEMSARRAAPFLVVFPGALYVASTDDAFFAGVGAWGIACAVLATRALGARRTVLALAGGGLLGGALMLSYGLVLLGVPVAAIVVARRSWIVLIVAGATSIAVIGAAASSGFWWFAGLAATRREYEASVAQERPAAAFLVINAAALAVVVGPVVWAGLGRVLGRRPAGAARREVMPGLGGVVAIGLVPIVLAAGSGLSKGEVERIWLPFAVWLVPAAAAMVAGRGVATLRGRLALQCTVAVVVQCLVRTNW